MNIKDIKKRADDLLMYCKPQMIRICMIMALVGLIPSIFTGTNNAFGSLLNFVISIFFLVFSHGYIVSSLKVVKNNVHELNDEDAFVGFKRFKELFPTYLVSELVRIVAGIIMFIVIAIVFAMIIGVTIPSIETIPQMVDEPINAFLYFIYAYPSFILIIFVMFIVIFVISLLMDAYLFAVPYLLEEYHYYNGGAIKESFAFMRGHIFDFIKLQLSFLGYMILTAIIAVVISMVLSFVPFIGAMLSGILTAFVSVYLYYPKYIVSQTIFFEEIAYYRYSQAERTDFYE